jgi:TolB-like protein/Flp pilus assembly protein TadD
VKDGTPHRFWTELRRRHVPQAAAWYVAGAWIAAQAGSLLLDAFDLGHYTRYVIGVIAAGFPVALALAWRFDITSRGIVRTLAPVEAPLPTVAATPAPERSIAVLPFANLSEDPANEYFSDGLSEEILNQLARVAGLRVAARTSSFAFKGRHEDVREIGRRLNVASVLEGGVRKHADTVRIDVQLVNATDGFQVWSQSFERRLEDVFRLQSEVASAVMLAVSERHASTARPLPAPAVRSFAAYNAYLLGRHHFHRRSEASLRRAAQCFEQAIAADPGYALAYSGLADTYALLSARYYGTMTPAEATGKALPLAQKALALDPTLAEAHASLGLILVNRGEPVEAERALEQAMSLNRGYTMAHIWHGLALTAQGRYREAAEHNREAFRLDPLSPIVNTNVGFDAWRFGEFEEAAARFRASIEIDPMFAVPYSGMSKLAARRGAHEEALRWIDQAIERAPARAYYSARRALLLLQCGQVEAAGDAVEAAAAKSSDGVFDPELRIALYMARGDRPALERIASGGAGDPYRAPQRAQAWIVLGDPAAARELYEQQPPDVLCEIDEILNDDWIWRLPHSVNLGHLRLLANDSRGVRDLERIVEKTTAVLAQGVRNADILCMAAAALNVLGRRNEAVAMLEEARSIGWYNDWWARIDWNLVGLADGGAR